MKLVVGSMNPPKQGSNLKARKLKYIFRIPLAFAIGMFFFACENDVKEVEKFGVLENMPSQKGKNVEILYSKDGQIEFKLNAPVLNRYVGEKPYNEMPSGVEVEVYDSLGNTTTHLTSNYAIDRDYEQIMIAKGDVVVINAEGEKLNTEELVWNQKTNMITSDVFVKITTGDQIIMGDGLESNQDFSRYKIKKIRGTINIDE